LVHAMRGYNNTFTGPRTSRFPTHNHTHLHTHTVTEHVYSFRNISPAPRPRSRSHITTVARDASSVAPRANTVSQQEHTRSPLTSYNQAAPSRACAGPRPGSRPLASAPQLRSGPSPHRRMLAPAHKSMGKLTTSGHRGAGGRRATPNKRCSHRARCSVSIPRATTPRPPKAARRPSRHRADALRARLLARQCALSALCAALSGWR